MGARGLRFVLRVTGAGLLIASGAIHLDLYLTGYRTIPTIGALFLFQVISTFLLAALVLLTGNRVVAMASAGACVATLGGYLVSLRTSLFGFREVRTTAGVTAGVIEVVALGALAALAFLPRSRSAPTTGAQLRMLWSAAFVTVAAGALLAVSVTVLVPTSSGKSSGQAVLEVKTIGGVSVLTNSKGFTIYWFAPDTPTKSTCVGVCADYWPPVPGSPVAGPGVTGTLSTIARSGGATQATYDGHPLYTYLGDAAPGQASGNNVNLNGGVWHEMAAAG